MTIEMLQPGCISVSDAQISIEPLAVPGTLDSLIDIAAYVLDAARVAGLEEKHSYRLRLAVDEIATNIIVHGYQEAGRQGNIWLYATIDARALNITLEDTGIAFDPQIYPIKTQFERSLAEREPGGLGIYLALNGVDGFSYAYIAGRNCNTLTMHRPVHYSAVQND